MQPGLVAVVQVLGLVLRFVELGLEGRLSRNSQGPLETLGGFLAGTACEARGLDLDLTTGADNDADDPQRAPPISTNSSTEPSSQDRSVMLWPCW